MFSCLKTPLILGTDNGPSVGDGRGLLCLPPYPADMPVVCAGTFYLMWPLQAEALTVWLSPALQSPGPRKGLQGFERLEERGTFAELLNLHFTSAKSSAA